MTIAPSLLSALRFLACAALLSPWGIAAARADTADDLAPLLSRKAVLVGEVHGGSGSLELTSKLVAAAVQRHACVTLALEIEHGQQPALDAAMLDRGSPQDLGLYPAIGHAAYRAWLSGLPRAVATHPCFRVLAADLPARQAGDRDRDMAQRIAAEVAAGRFVVGLFGALHVSRGVAYRYSGHHSAADDLVRRGIPVVSVLESPAPACAAGGLRAPGSPDAAPAILDLRHTVNGVYPGNPARIVDAVWLGPAGNCATSAAAGSGLLNVGNPPAELPVN